MRIESNTKVSKLHAQVLDHPMPCCVSSLLPAEASGEPQPQPERPLGTADLVLPTLLEAAS